MLKNIPKIISPDLIKILCEMGHGDEIVIADGNFPASTCAKRLVRLDGHGAVEVLKAVLKLIPVDTYSEKPIALMELVESDRGKINPVIWEEYKKAIKEEKERCEIEFVKRFDFYERAKNAYAVIATGESALYANILLTKGVI